MSVITRTVFSVLDKFPDHKQTIMRLFRQSEDFQSLCEDYGRCIQALRHWKQSDDERAPARRQEYRTLLRELAAEILQYLKESKGSEEIE
jgi:hypothetical protein